MCTKAKELSGRLTVSISRGLAKSLGAVTVEGGCYIFSVIGHTAFDVFGK